MSDDKKGQTVIANFQEGCLQNSSERGRERDSEGEHSICYSLIFAPVKSKSVDARSLRACIARHGELRDPLAAAGVPQLDLTRPDLTRLNSRWCRVEPKHVGSIA